MISLVFARFEMQEARTSGSGQCFSDVSKAKLVALLIKSTRAMGGDDLSLVFCHTEHVQRQLICADTYMVGSASDRSH